MANDFFAAKAQALGRDVRRGMVEKDHLQLPVAVQYRLLSIPQSTFHHRPPGETIENLALIQVIDQQFMRRRSMGFGR